MPKYFEENYSAIKFPLGAPGLRNPQRGAIHAIASFFTLDNLEIPMVVLPTGTGKTAIIMMSPFLLCAKRVLIVTPTAIVRNQIFLDFVKLSTLKKTNVIDENVKPPIVAELKKQFKDGADYSDLLSVDVVVATPNVAFTLSNNEEARSLFDLIIIDEAHHLPAKTWSNLIKNFPQSKSILFTATPFRGDRKPIVCKIIYDYPLSQAYKDGVFGEVAFIPVFNTGNPDLEIAKKVEEVLNNDRTAGYDHYILVRTDSLKHARDLETLYKNNTSLKLKRLDSTMSSKVIETSIRELNSKLIDGIICVDMFGEGFDFPNLKIAAIHAPKKSLSATLQFIGRFARVNSENIGNAKFIAVKNDDLRIANQKLYSENAIWKNIIIDMSESASKFAVNRQRHLENYEVDYFFGKPNIEAFSLFNLVPNCHVRVYRASNFNVDAPLPAEFLVSHPPFRNHLENIVIFITSEVEKPKWVNSECLENHYYQLYIVHYQKETGLLFIHTSKKSEYTYSLLAETFSESHVKVDPKEVYRIFSDLSNLDVYNTGLVRRHSMGETYRISAGSNVTEVIDLNTSRNYSPGHIFCTAIDNGFRKSLGYSTNAKFWCADYKNINEFVKWCDYYGNKINDPGVTIQTHTSIDNLQISEKLQHYPDNILSIQFPYDTFINSPMVEYNNISVGPLSDFDIEYIESSKDILKFVVVNGSVSETLSIDIDGNIRSLSNTLKLSGEFEGLGDYLSNYGISIYTTTDDLVSDGFILPNSIELPKFDADVIKPINWDSFGTDVYLETSCDDSKITIHKTISRLLFDNPENNYLLYDHTTGEIADFITVTVKFDQILITVYHVKAKSSNSFNSNLTDIYDVVNQAIKSLIWTDERSKFISKVESRRQVGHCKMLKGDISELLKDVRNLSRSFRTKVVIVQPGLSGSVALPDKFQEILGAMAFYLLNHGKVDSYEIWGS